MDRRRYIAASTRTDIIDYIEDNYNTAEGWEELEDAISELFGDGVLDDDSDEDEGFYANLSDSELKKLKNHLDSNKEAAYGPGKSYSFNSKELNVLVEAMRDFSNPSFTKDRQMSLVAKQILKKLTN